MTVDVFPLDYPVITGPVGRFLKRRPDRGICLKCVEGVQISKEVRAFGQE